MVNTKKSKKVLIGLVSLLFLVSIGLNIFQQKQIRKLSKEANDKIPTENQSTNDVISILEAIQSNTSCGMALNYRAKEPNQDQIDELEYQLDASEEELDLALKQISDSAARKAQIDEKERELQEYFAFQGPSEEDMRNSMISQYSDVFEELKLSHEKQEEIIDILVNNSMASFESSKYVQNATLSEEKRAEFTERQKVLREKSEEAQEKIKDILGNSDYVKYQEYIDTMGARYAVNQFADSLNEGENLTEQQQQGLITAMHEQLKEISDEVRNDDTQFLFPSERVTVYDNEEQMANANRRREAYLNAAQEILSATQFEDLKEYLQKEREQVQLRMEIQALRNAE